jgi:hypothetical protein
VSFKIGVNIIKKFIRSRQESKYIGMAFIDNLIQSKITKLPTNELDFFKMLLAQVSAVSL